MQAPILCSKRLRSIRLRASLNATTKRGLDEIHAIQDSERLAYDPPAPDNYLTPAQYISGLTDFGPGRSHENWPTWYAEYMVREQTGQELPQ